MGTEWMLTEHRWITEQSLQSSPGPLAFLLSGGPIGTSKGWDNAATWWLLGYMQAVNTHKLCTHRPQPALGVESGVSPRPRSQDPQGSGGVGQALSTQPSRSPTSEGSPRRKRGGLGTVTFVSLEQRRGPAGGHRVCRTAPVSEGNAGRGGGGGAAAASPRSTGGRAGRRG